MASDLQAPTYVVVAEGTAAGVTFRPVFIGSADRFSDARWTRPLLAVSGSPLTTPGSLVFSLGGQFIGPAVLGADGTLAVAAAAEVMAAVGEASAGHILASRDFGLHLQSLTPTLGRLLHATQGVVVADVDSNSPAAGALEPADVITSIDGVAIASPDEALVLLARTRPEARVQVAIVRQGAPPRVSVTGVPSKARGAGGEALPRMERVAGEGTRISEVPPGTALADAGVQAGDIVIRLGSTAAPAPQEVTSALRAGADGIGVVLVIRRDGEDRVIGIPPSSAPR